MPNRPFGGNTAATLTACASAEGFSGDTVPCRTVVHASGSLPGADSADNPCGAQYIAPGPWKGAGAGTAGKDALPLLTNAPNEVLRTSKWSSRAWSRKMLQRDAVGAG